MNSTTMNSTKKVLISGASIAGPALAHWLSRYGFDVTVVERAPQLRPGGTAVDYRGAAQLTVLRRMGVLEQLRALDPGMGEQVMVDESGRELVRLPASLMSGELEVARGDLSRVLYEASVEHAEYVFGDSIASLTETADGVRVTFENGAPRSFDLVVGADGLHSHTRRLAFGPEEAFRVDSGYHLAIFSVPNRLGLRSTGRMFNSPGKLVGVSNTGGRTGAMLVFQADGLTYDYRDTEQQRKIVSEVYRGEGWETPAVLDAMRDADDFYFDSISQIQMDRWSSGRVVLLGDAAWASAIGGMGNGLAVVGAYILAGELATAGDHRTAFARYERLMRPYVAGCQKQGRNAGPFLAPPTQSKIRTRNRVYRLLSNRMMSGLFNRLTTRTANAIELQDYPATYPVTYPVPAAG